MLQPACERCGSTLRPHSPDPAAVVEPRERMKLPRALRLAIVIGAAALVAAAARARYNGGGIPLAAVTGAGMSFLLVPLLRRR